MFSIKRDSSAPANRRQVLAWCTFVVIATAWCTFVVIAIALASAVHALASTGLAEYESAAAPDACRATYPSTAALADGDGVRARFLVMQCERVAAW
jgi:hypothetical protein